ncbi:hypothetical protein CBR_g81551 [Chara braunii]|uniref:Peptidase M41 domain-containing protein n=1 Tax=Chara braunii TaxID=69332 RepID=A0A388KAR9_CHABU|nr:hypothetical protein CBR_g81551 [Chara braunii]|eukprot:GBG67127.1 hypothetical protein CBR_g81551 [Chara braunii]
MEGRSCKQWLAEEAITAQLDLHRWIDKQRQSICVRASEIREDQQQQQQSDAQLPSSSSSSLSISSMSSLSSLSSTSPSSYPDVKRWRPVSKREEWGAYKMAIATGDTSAALSALESLEEALNTYESGTYGVPSPAQSSTPLSSRSSMSASTSPDSSRCEGEGGEVEFSDQESSSSSSSSLFEDRQSYGSESESAFSSSRGSNVLSPSVHDILSNSESDMQLLSASEPDLSFLSAVGGRNLDAEVEEVEEEVEESDGWMKESRSEWVNKKQYLTSVFPEIKSDCILLLDTCLSTPDIRLVISAYDWLQKRKILSNFGKEKLSAAGPSDLPEMITPSVLKSVTGMDVSCLAPQKWGVSGSSAIVLAVALAAFSAAEDATLLVRPIAVLLMCVGIADSVWLGGRLFSSLASSFWKPYRKRVMVHEAGHTVVAYLLGCPIRGVVLDPWQAMNMGIQGQAGTQFWDSTLEEELRSGKLSAASLDRYSMVLFAGIAAEAMVFGQASGGESDENMFKAIIKQLQPAWSAAKMSNQARRAIAKSFLLLKANRKALIAVVDALEEEGGRMSAIAMAVENALSPVS